MSYSDGVSPIRCPHVFLILVVDENVGFDISSMAQKSKKNEGLDWT